MPMPTASAIPAPTARTAPAFHKSWRTLAQPESSVAASAPAVNVRMASWTSGSSLRPSSCRKSSRRRCRTCTDPRHSGHVGGRPELQHCRTHAVRQCAWKQWRLPPLPAQRMAASASSKSSVHMAHSPEKSCGWPRQGRPASLPEELNHSTAASTLSHRSAASRADASGTPICRRAARVPPPDALEELPPQVQWTFSNLRGRKALGPVYTISMLPLQPRSRWLQNMGWDCISATQMFRESPQASHRPRMIGVTFLRKAMG
mmetsp:Transcript_53309/g.159023  ORF Transcript_53309/g.159023 Transcript_53309/m.159023 type:complete len:260 (-) Transcript_53309:68-847(-)